MSKYAIYYVPLSNAYCGLFVATSPLGAMRQANQNFSKQEQYNGFTALSANIATEEQISHVRSMGGRVPELPKRQRKRYSSSNGSRKD